MNATSMNKIYLSVCDDITKEHYYKDHKDLTANEKEAVRNVAAGVMKELFDEWLAEALKTEEGITKPGIALKAFCEAVKPREEQA